MQILREMPSTWPLPLPELEPALELAVVALRADMGVVLLRDDSSTALVPVIASGLSRAQGEMMGAGRVMLELVDRSIAEHRRLVVRDAWHADDGVATLARQLGFRGIEVLPLCGASGDGVGAIATMYRKRRGASPRSVRLVECCAQLVVSAILQARLHVAAERAANDARDASRARAELVARMSHELRTPLQSIVGYIDLLCLDGAEPLTPTQASMLERVRTSEQMLNRVISDLIVFSQLEAGHVTYRLEPVPAREAMTLAQSVVAPLAADRKVRFANPSCAPDVLVVADHEKLAQVLVNLAANGVKFTNPGGTVALQCVAEGDVVRFEVSDTGDGIPAERLDDIFEPYVRLDGSQPARVEGSGLGLAISREFASAMGGYLTVRSTVGAGSVFTLGLRRAKADVAPPEREQPVARRRPAAA